METYGGYCPICNRELIDCTCAEELLKEKKDLQRKAYIKEHGRCCETCDNDPTNHGQRDSCRFITGPGYVGYHEGDPICREEDGYPHYEEAKTLYAIDINYCC